MRDKYLLERSRLCGEEDGAMMVVVARRKRRSAQVSARRALALATGTALAAYAGSCAAVFWRTAS
jgi:hypothetical protein